MRPLDDRLSSWARCAKLTIEGFYCAAFIEFSLDTICFYFITAFIFWLLAFILSCSRFKDWWKFCCLLFWISRRFLMSTYCMQLFSVAYMLKTGTPVSKLYSLKGLPFWSGTIYVGLKSTFATVFLDARLFSVCVSSMPVVAPIDFLPFCWVPFIMAAFAICFLMIYESATVKF